MGLLIALIPRYPLWALRTALQSRRTHNVAEEHICISTILCHVRLGRQVFHVSCFYTSRTKLSQLFPSFSQQNLPDPSPFFFFLLTRSSQPTLLPAHLPTPTVQNAVTKHSPCRHCFYGLLLLRKCLPVVRFLSLALSPSLSSPPPSSRAGITSS